MTDRDLMIKGRECEKCKGSGYYLYPNTATYRSKPDLISGRACTRDVCDACWGSGSPQIRWPSHLEAYYNTLNGDAIHAIRVAVKEIMGDNCAFIDDDFARTLLKLNEELNALREAHSELSYRMEGLEK